MTDPFEREVAALPGQLLWSPKPQGALGPGPRVLAGMGGSALAAEAAARALPSPERPGILRQDRLPASLSAETGVVCVSFSGNTRETLSVWHEAGAQNRARAAVASGGALLESARAAGAPWVEVPEGLAPRSSLGYLLRGCLALCAPDPEPDFAAAAAHLEVVAEAQRRRPVPDPAHWPEGGWIVVCDRTTALAAARWQADFSENAKMPLGLWVFPEAAHNALMILAEESRYPRPGFYCLESTAQGGDTGWREFLRVLQERGAPMEVVRHPHRDPWVEQLGLAYAGDWQSLWAARGLGVPAASLSLLDAFKARLDRPLAP